MYSTIKNNYFSLIALLAIFLSIFWEGSIIGFTLIFTFLIISYISKSLISIFISGLILHSFIFYLLGEVYSSNFTKGLWFQLFASWISAIIFVSRLAFIKPKIDFFKKIMVVVVPFFFGLWVILLWEIICIGFNVPQLLLPAPSLIGVQISNSLDLLYADFYQTVIKAVIPGYIYGCGSAFILSIIIDRSPFLQRGLLPIGNLVSAMPIVGVAPIMVMWFGFDWQSKAAVVTIMTFFPMLVNTVAGLQVANNIDHDVMSTWGSSYWQSLFKMRLPKALPLIFNGLKINTTLALIGAIVAEFFGTPVVGMGFRISVEAQRMSFDLVWAEIAMAALVGSCLYGILALLERYLTFWHPSFHSR
tara:strand:- start:178 stop:1257 length:1080 start_codon:yes stop_codon:yes gene_type:complete